MSVFTARIEAHPLQKNLEVVYDLVSEAALVLPSDLEAISSAERLKNVVATIRAYLAAADPELLPLNPLNAINEQIELVRAELLALQNDRQLGHLNAANSAADKAIAQLAVIGVMAAVPDTEALREVVTSFRRAAAQHLRYLEEDTEKLRATFSEYQRRADEVISDLAAQRSRTDHTIVAAQNQVSAMQDQFSKAEESRRDQFARAEEARSQQVQQILAQIQAQTAHIQAQWSEAEARRADQFQNAEAQRLEQFSQTIAAAQKQLSETIIRIDKEREDWEADWMDRADEVLSNLADAKGKAEKLMNVIGITGMAAGYQQTANKASRAALVWSVTAAMSMLGIAGFAIFAFWPTLAGEFNWGSFVARAFVSLTFGVLAGYAAQQAAHFQRAESRNRRYELELASIDAYLALLPAEQIHEVKKQLAGQLFGRAETLDANPGNSVPVSSMLDLFKTVVTNLSNK